MVYVPHWHAASASRLLAFDEKVAHPEDDECAYGPAGTFYVVGLST